MPLFGLLHLAFFYLHYMFASQTAHVGALYSAFCAMMLSAGGCARARGAGLGLESQLGLVAVYSQQCAKEASDAGAGSERWVVLVLLVL